MKEIDYLLNRDGWLYPLTATFWVMENDGLEVIIESVCYDGQAFSLDWPEDCALRAFIEEECL